MQSHKGVGNIWIRTTVYCNGWYTLCTVHAEKVLYQLALHELATNLDLIVAHCCI